MCEFQARLRSEDTPDRRFIQRLHTPQVNHDQQSKADTSQERPLANQEILEQDGQLSQAGFTTGEGTSAGFSVSFEVYRLRIKCIDLRNDFVAFPDSLTDTCVLCRCKATEHRITASRGLSWHRCREESSHTASAYRRSAPARSHHRATHTGEHSDAYSQHTALETHWMLVYWVVL